MILARTVRSAQNQAFALVLCLLLSQTAGFADEADGNSAPPGAFVDSTASGTPAASQPAAPASAPVVSPGDLGDPSIVPTAQEMQVAPVVPPAQGQALGQGQGQGQILPVGGLNQAQQPPQGWQPQSNAATQIMPTGQPVFAGQQQQPAFVQQQPYQPQTWSPGAYGQPQTGMAPQSGPPPYGAPPQQGWQPVAGSPPVTQAQWAQPMQAGQMPMGQGQMPVAQPQQPNWAQQYQTGMQTSPTAQPQQQVPQWTQSQPPYYANGQPQPGAAQPPQNLSATVQSSQQASAPPGSWTADYPSWKEASDPNNTGNSSNSMLGSNPAQGDYGYNPFGGVLPKTGSNFGFGLPTGNMNGLMMLGTALGAWLGSRGLNNNNNLTATTANPMSPFGNSMGFNSNPLAALFASQTGSMTGNPLAGLFGNSLLSMFGAGSAAGGFNPMMMGMNNFGTNPLTSGQSRAIIGNQAFRSGSFTRRGAFSIPFPGRILNQALNRGINRSFYSSLRYVRF